MLLFFVVIGGGVVSIVGGGWFETEGRGNSRREGFWACTLPASDLGRQDTGDLMLALDAAEACLSGAVGASASG